MNISQIIKKKLFPRLSRSLIIFILATLGIAFLFSINRLGIKALNKRIFSDTARQSAVLPYYFKAGTDDYTLIIGDLNCLNADGRKIVKAKVEANLSADSLVIFPGLCTANTVPTEKIDINDFSNRISNESGVVLVDNFCTNNWEKLKDKPLYAGSGLTPGPYCASEPETALLDKIIRNFHVKKIILLYNVESYKTFVANFLEYLDERKITYEFIKNNDY